MAQDLFQIAQEHHRGGRYRQAEEGYRAALAREPGHVDALHWLGVLTLQAGRAAEAIPMLEKSAAARPNDVAFGHNLAQAYLSCARRDDAIETFERVMAIDPQPRVLMGAAAARIARQAPGDAEAAVALYRKVLAAGVDTGELRMQLGTALLLAGQVAEAVGECQAAVRALPESADAHYSLAAAFARAGDAGTARFCLARTLELKPNEARACFAWGVLEAEEGKLAEAEALFRVAIAQKPDSAAAYEALSVVLAKLDNPTEAAEAKDAAARLARGGALRVPLGSTSESIAALEKRLARSPQAQKLHVLLSVKTNLAPPPQLPPGAITGLFDQYAENFDRHLVQTLEYRVPEMIADAVRATRPPRKLDVMDLGCGTGLCAPLLRPMAATLVGVDASPEMIRKARDRFLYDRLEAGDLVEALKRVPRSFDLLVAADVLVYSGDLAPFFEASAAALRPGGMLAFSAEAGKVDRFRLDVATRRFTHSADYLKHLASICGFREELFRPITVRLEARRPVQGFLVLLRLAE